MNKTILTLVVAAFLATNARAALLLSDDFNSYPDGSLVGPARHGFITAAAPPAK